MDKKALADAQKKMMDDVESVKDRLNALPNVVAVGVGLKETGGEFTDEISFRVFVREKIDRSKLADDEIVPDEIDGFKTDVLKPYKIRDRLDVCGNERSDNATHRPLQAGIAVSTKTDRYGTLGWFATLDADNTALILTNKHVFWDGVDEVVTDNRPAAQPMVGVPSACCCCDCGSDNVVGETLLGVRNMSPPTATSVDAAIARIHPQFTSDISLTISNNSTDQILTVSGTGTATVGDSVRKIGARSAFTRGTVVHVGDAAAAAPDPDGSGTITVVTGQVLVIPDGTETYQVRDSANNCKPAFSNNGDSGSVILNAADEIIALLYGGDPDDASVDVTFACDISDVLSAMSGNSFPITLRTSPGDGRTAYARTDAIAEMHRRHPPAVAAPEAEANIFERLRDTNRESLLAWLYERHHREVLGLINQRRAVTVAWHRAQGPAYVAALSRASRVEHYRVPFEIEGIDRATLLREMEAVLMTHGSEALQCDIERHRDELMTLAYKWHTVAELAHVLKRRGLLDDVPELEIQSNTGS